MNPTAPSLQNVARIAENETSANNRSPLPPDRTAVDRSAHLKCIPCRASEDMAAAAAHYLLPIAVPRDTAAAQLNTTGRDATRRRGGHFQIQCPVLDQGPGARGSVGAGAGERTALTAPAEVVTRSHLARVPLRRPTPRLGAECQERPEAGEPREQAGRHAPSGFSPSLCAPRSGPGPSITGMDGSVT